MNEDRETLYAFSGMFHFFPSFRSFYQINTSTADDSLNFSFLMENSGLCDVFIEEAELSSVSVGMNLHWRIIWGKEMSVSLSCSDRGNLCSKLTVFRVLESAGLMNRPQ
ncbi:hypothetical protein QQP08_025961 [Theobroma cacao]|nr:hypothetical protein QQP08_025961 [Theobroma cacao]